MFLMKKVSLKHIRSEYINYADATHFTSEHLPRKDLHDIDYRNCQFDRLYMAPGHDMALCAH